MQTYAILSPNNLVWLAQILYTICFIPQIWENYTVKSGKGLSDYFLLAYLNTYVTLIYYVFCLGLPLAYKVLNPLQCAATIIVIIQRLYYNNSPGSKFYRNIYVINIFGSLLFLPLAYCYPSIIGHVFGWISFFIILLNQMPQVVKLIRTKSVAGFSYLFVLITTVAALTELYAGLMLGLPMQTVLSAARGLLYFSIFTVLFLMYGNNRNLEQLR
jgi:uncharacterized protein with PQ loop repeat